MDHDGRDGRDQIGPKGGFDTAVYLPAEAEQQHSVDHQHDQRAKIGKHIKRCAVVYVAFVKGINPIEAPAYDQKRRVDAQQRRQGNQQGLFVFDPGNGQHQHGHHVGHEARRQHFDKRDDVKRRAHPRACQAIHELPGQMGGDVQKEQQKEDLEIPPHFLPQMNGGRDLHKAQAADAYARRDEQHIDEIHRGDAEKHADSSF